MISVSGSPSVERASQESEFAQLIGQIMARLQAGEPLDWDSLARQHPEHADRLAEVLPAMQALAALALPTSGSPLPRRERGRW